MYQTHPKSPKQEKKKDKSFLPNKKRKVKYTPPIIFAGRIRDQHI